MLHHVKGKQEINLSHTIFLLLRFCCAVKYCSVWHVVEYFISRPRAHQEYIADFRTWSVSAGGKHAFDLSVQRGKRSTKTERVKQKWQTHWFRCFFCLPLLHQSKAQCYGSGKKQFIPAVRAWGCHHTGHHFIYPGKLSLKQWHFDLT